MLGLGAPALAQAGAWHPPSAPESGLRDQTQEVVLLAPALDPYPRGELTRAFASLGIRAQSIGEARLDPALEACGTFSCLSQVARKSRGRAALARISSAGDGTQSLLLVLVDEDGQHAQSRVRVDAGLGAALAAAWRDASLAIALGNDAMIQLATRPSGARVWLDGAEAGTTPFARRVSAGPHRLIVKLEGFVAQERVLETRPGQVEAVQLALKREPRFDVGDLRDAPASGPSAWNYVLGGTLLLVAAPALIASVNALVNDGQCLRAGAAPDMCERARFGSRSAYLFAAGVVAFGTGGALLFARPLGAGPSPRVAADGTRDAAGPAGW